MYLKLFQKIKKKKRFPENFFACVWNLTRIAWADFKYCGTKLLSYKDFQANLFLGPPLNNGQNKFAQTILKPIFIE